MNIVILNGWAMPGSIWGQFCDLLNSNLTDERCRVIDIDRRLSVDQWVQYLDDLIQPDTLLIGWSLGGMLALEFASQHPEKIRGVCTLQMNPKFVAADDWSSAMDLDVFNEFSQLAGSDIKVDIQNLIKRFSFLVTAKGLNGVGDLRALKSAFSVDSIPAKDILCQSLELLEMLDVRDKINALKVPQLHLLGEYDQLVPQSAFEQIKALNNGAYVELLEGVSHCPCFSAAERTAKRVAEFAGALN